MSNHYQRENEEPAAFICNHCRRTVLNNQPGTHHRNHCPFCLWSRHLDHIPGDRKAGCFGAMEPIAIWVKPGGEWSLIHRCQSCKTVHPNRIAGDDNEMLLLSLAAKALANPPFPLEYVLRDGVR